MSIKRIFILNGHPAESSLSKAISETYLQTAREAGHEVRLMHLHDMAFDADYGFAGYARHKPLEPDLETFRENVEWAQHMVMATPMWWGGLPAKLKGLFDRTFLPGWAFNTRKMKLGLPEPMLSGRSARVFMTSDTPNWAFGLLYRKAMQRQIESQIFHYVGIKPVRFCHFSPATKATPEKVKTWLDKAAESGRQGG